MGGDEDLLWAQPKPFPTTAAAPGAVYVTFWATLFAAWIEAAAAKTSANEICMVEVDYLKI